MKKKKELQKNIEEIRQEIVYQTQNNASKETIIKLLEELDRLQNLIHSTDE
ncbi:hypothetical protein [Halobacillus yeomjeoni]|uniref:Spo0E like sporulation regulatory protein n=1 Tax=Halobacillus yeomjeoni TaxID=311194 RepID=A0A931HWN4_9BACI|nr:hypothetical protein [Halobacillus yeomjeoni]MBH0230798.1 hypothetical protein [Halobacillus yeomjeoni]